MSNIKGGVIFWLLRPSPEEDIDFHRISTGSMSFAESQTPSAGGFGTWTHHEFKWLVARP
jgi:hypothetical protein